MLNLFPRTKSVLLFVLICLVKSTFAEYQGYLYTLELTKTSGQVLDCYYQSNILLDDSLFGDSQLLLNRFGYTDGDNNTYLELHKTRIPYRYICVHSKTEQLEYALNDYAAFYIDSVSSIQVKEVHEFSYTTSISCRLNTEDTLWMNTKATDSFLVGGLLCEYQVISHSDELDLESLEAVCVSYVNKVEEKINELNEVLNWADGEEYRKAEKDINTLEENLDTELFEIIGEYCGKKVVILSYCTD
jgi:hypothetical protein